MSRFNYSLASIQQDQDRFERAAALREEEAAWKARHCEGLCCNLSCCNAYGGGIGTETEGQE